MPGKSCHTVKMKPSLARGNTKVHLGSLPFVGFFLTAQCIYRVFSPLGNFCAATGSLSETGD